MSDPTLENKVTLADKVAALRGEYSRLQEQVAAEVAKARDEERVKYSLEKSDLEISHQEAVNRLNEGYRLNLAELEKQYESMVTQLKEAYQANTNRILDSLDQATRDRDKAQAEADSWKTKFNEYIKRHL